MITATRYHDLSCGHRVVGHESKCAHLHGHNYRIHFTVIATTLDKVGRVMDFSVINDRLCMWVEGNWDHKFLAWNQDAVMMAVEDVMRPWMDGLQSPDQDKQRAALSIVWTPFNPTAENMASYLLRFVGPKQLEGTGVRLVRVTVEETRKCSASAVLGPED